MKTDFSRFALPLLALAACSALLHGAPVQQTTAVHTRPDRTAPAISYLNAGTEPPPAPAAAGATTPAGWLAVELPGPFEGYVENKDLDKSLNVKPGTPIRLAPKPDAGVLAVAEKDDKTSITGLRGRWNQISLEKKLVGYIQIGSTSSPTPPPAATPAAPTTQAPAPMAPAPVAPGVYGVASPGQAAPGVSIADANSLPRQFAGRFVSTRRPFTPRRPYDYALNDDAGKRVAYLDVSKLLQTEQIESYVDRAVVVYGAARAIPNSRDILIVVETLQLR
jgi:hypothetical protein